MDRLFQFLSNSSPFIAKDDFVKVISKQSPVDTLVERLKTKIRKGGERLLRALYDEFMEADIPYGCEGNLPLANFQTILNDYDIPMLVKDIDELKSKKLVIEDGEKNLFVFYKRLLNEIKPKKVVEHPGHIMNCIIKLQSLFRGYRVRKTISLRKGFGVSAIKDQFDAIGGASKPVEEKKKMTREEAKKAAL